jgi:hypothetical protein
MQGASELDRRIALDLAVIKWQLGIVLAGVAILVMKAFP